MTTKKHFIAVANIIKDLKKEDFKECKTPEMVKNRIIERLTLDFSYFFSMDNPNFNRTKFFEYIESEKRKKDFTE